MKYLWLILERAHGACFGLLASIILARTLDVNDFGVYKTLLSYSTIVSLLFYFSFGDVLVRFLPEIKRNQSSSAIGLLICLAVLRILTFSALIFVLWVNREFVLAIINIQLSDLLFAIFAAYMLLLAYNNLIGRSFMTADSRRPFLSIVLMIKESVRVLGFVVILLLNCFSLENVLVVIVITELIFAFYYSSDFASRFREFINFSGAKLALLGRVSRYGLSNYFRQSAYSMRDVSVDMAVITSMSSTIGVGYYGVAAAVSGFFRNVSFFRIFYGILLPETVAKYDLMKSEDRETVQALFKRIDRVQFVIVVPVFLSLGALLSEFIVILYGYDYSPAVMASFLLFLGVFFVNASDAYFMLISILELNRVSALLAISAGFLNLFFDIVLVYFFGFLGAAIATVIVSVVSYLFLIYYFYRLNISIIQDGRYYYLTLLCNLPLLIGGVALNMNDIGWVLKFGSSFLLLLVSVLLGMFYVIDRQDRKLIYSLMRK